MSTIVTDTITGKSTATTITIGSTPVVSASANSMTIRGENALQTSIQQGLAKSWNQSVGDGTAMNDNFNVTDITDTATGRINVNLTSNMQNDDYAIVGSQGDDGRAQNCYSPSTSEYEAMTTLTSNQNAVDVSLNCSAVLGDLA